MPPTTISACIVAYNEEQVIERCLASIRDVVDEIIVFHDGPCDDATLDIARRFGAYTAELPRVGHAERHTVLAFERAQSEWLLEIDADEFLSDELGAQLRTLVARTEVNGYEFLWKMWDGTRYITDKGPYKRMLFRKRATHLIGHIHSAPAVDPPVVRVPLHLEHRPLYNNFALRTMLTKWRRWARIHARESLAPLETLPSFNMDPPPRWGPRRRALNALSPVLVVPYMAATFLVALWKNRELRSASQALRFASYAAFYGGMVQLYIAKYLYIDRARPWPRRSRG